MEITLTAEQQQLHSKLITAVNKIESAMANVIEYKDHEQLKFEIMSRTEMLHNNGQLLSWATALYDNAHGQVASYMLTNEALYKAANIVQKSWMQGQLTKWNALFVRTERVLKDLNNSIDGIISVLSYEKEAMKHSV